MKALIKFNIDNAAFYENAYEIDTILTFVKKKLNVVYNCKAEFKIFDTNGNIIGKVIVEKD